MKFTPLLVILTLLFSPQLKSQENQKWSLDTCINYALKHNLGLLKQDLTISMLENNYQMARFNQLPGVSASLNTGTYFGRSFNYNELAYVNDNVTYASGDVAANATLFNGFKQRNTIAKRKQETESSKANRQVQANNLAIEIVNNYLNILYNREQVIAAEAQLKVTQKQIERTEQLVTAGSVPKGDILELKAQAAEEKSKIVSFVNREREARIYLKQAMNLVEDSISIEKPNGINAEALYAKLPAIKEIYNTAIGHLPELAAAKANLKAKEMAIKIAKSDYYPQLNLGVSVSSSYNELATDPKNPTANYKFMDQFVDYGQQNFGVSLSIPIFNKMQVKYNVDNARIDYKKAEYDKNITLQNIYKTIESSLNDARSAYQSYKAEEEALKASKESFHYAEQRFNAGLINSVDYNLAKTNLANAEVALLNARYELIFMVKILDFYMGRGLKL